MDRLSALVIGNLVTPFLASGTSTPIIEERLLESIHKNPLFIIPHS
jgi:hypothetical protein